MTFRHRRPDAERGAVAVTVALLSVVLVGIGAFTLDFGMSYVSTRQLQLSSDAGALAAAGAYATVPGNCATMAANTTARAAAQTAADKLRSDNDGRASSTGSTVTATCNAEGTLDVSYTSTGRTPALLGPIFGRSSDYVRSRSATATVSVSPQANARPYALCSGTLPTTFPSSVVKLSFPNPSDPAALGCPSAEAGGNWWTVLCPGVTNSGHLGDETRDGCDEPINIVPNQPDPTTPAARSAFLANACPSITNANKSRCLGTDTGQIRGTPILDEWDAFVTAQKQIIVPVFCGEPDCTPSGLSDPSGGGNVIYPVYKLAAITICGYHWGPKSADNLTSGPCANNPSGYDADVADSNANYLLVVTSAVRVSGGTKEFACELGEASCDGGVRRVLLTR